MVSPVLRDGRGLKLVFVAPAFTGALSIARPSGRARIETSLDGAVPPVMSGIARPSGRARIETAAFLAAAALARAVSPVLRDGRGLKLDERTHYHVSLFVSPVLRDGRGLKPVRRSIPNRLSNVSPVLRDGRGLKQILFDILITSVNVSPVLRDGRGLKLAGKPVNGRLTLYRPSFGTGAD